jgi:hypothetical protein
MTCDQEGCTHIGIQSHSHLLMELNGSWTGGWVFSIMWYKKFDELFFEKVAKLFKFTLKKHTYPKVSLLFGQKNVNIVGGKDWYSDAIELDLSRNMINGWKKI